MLGTPALQEWIRALAGFNVLGSPVICVACLRMSNSLFGLREWMLFARFLRYSKLVKWPKRLPVLHGMLPCQCGEFLRKRAVSPLLLAQVTHTGSWKLPPRCMAWLGRCSTRCGRESLYPDTSPRTKSSIWWPRPFELCTMKRLGLTTRMVKFILQRPGVEPPKRICIDHDMGGKTSPQPPPKPSTQPSSSSKRPHQQKDDGQDGKCSRETAAQSSSSWYHRPAPADWDWQWQSWQWQGYSGDYHDWNNQYGSRR